MLEIGAAYTYQAKIYFVIAKSGTHYLIFCNEYGLTWAEIHYSNAELNNFKKQNIPKPFRILNLYRRSYGSYQHEVILFELKDKYYGIKFKSDLYGSASHFNFNKNETLLSAYKKLETKKFPYQKFMFDKQVIKLYSNNRSVDEIKNIKII